MVSQQAVVLADPDTGNTNMSFAQPVAVNRLRMLALSELDEPLEDAEVKLQTFETGIWRKTVIESQSATGAVTVRYEDGTSRVTQLQSEECHWVY